MKILRKLIALAVALAALYSMVPGSLRAEEETASQREARLAWWHDARFGIFIHWDMSSIAGTEISWSRKGAKPLDVTGYKAGYVEDPVYDHLYERFDPQKFDAGKWVRLAQDAGMKYIVFTAKHHGGFCMWDTKFTDYSIMHTPFKRDVVRELADACHKAGMRFGLYYSPRDWHQPDYGIGDDSKYYAYLKGQLTELLSNYGRVDIMWFDSFGHGDSIRYWHADEILALVKHLQPEIIVNNRCSFFGESIASLQGDFDTPEQRLGEFQNHRAWESCICVVDAPGGGWSYRTDGKVKSFAECMKALLGCATGDGNLLLDVGPNSLGEIPEDQSNRLREIGAWMKEHGRTIYGTRGGPFRNGAWGGSTFRDYAIYLHVAKWNGDRLELPGLKSKILKCLRFGGSRAAVAFVQSEEKLIITLPEGDQDPVDTVIELKLDQPAETEFKNGQPL